jgi:DNA primase
LSFDLPSWLQRHIPGGRTTSSGWYRARCVFHNETSPSFAVKVTGNRPGSFGCLAASCGRKGGLVRLIKEVEGISWAEAFQRIDQPNPFALDDVAVSDQVVRAPRATVNPLPAGLVPVSAERYPTYLRDRRYALEDVAPHGLLFGDGACPTLRGYLVFPYWTIDGQYRTYSARRMGDDGRGPRHLKPDEGLANAMLYGAWRIAALPRLDRLYCVEGQFDVLRMWSLGLPAVGLSTASTTAAQRNQVVEIARQFDADVVVLLDRGASEDQSSAEIASLLRARGVRAESASLPEGVKDPDGLDAASVKLLLDIGNERALEQPMEQTEGSGVQGAQDD